MKTQRYMVFAALVAVASGCATAGPGFGGVAEPPAPTRSGEAPSAPVAVAQAGPDYSGWNLGMLSASGKYNTLPRTGFVYYTPEAAAADRKAGAAATSGFSLGHDAVNFLDLNLPERLLIGVNTSWNVAYVNVDWKSIYEQPVSSSVGDLASDLTIGPVFSLNATGSVYFEGGFRIGVGVAGVRGMTIENYQLQGGNTADVTESGGVGVGFATAFGLRFRWERLIVGAEWMSFGGNQTRKYEITTCCTNSRDESFEYKSDVGTKFSRIYIGLTTKK